MTGGSGWQDVCKGSRDIFDLQIRFRGSNKGNTDIMRQLKFNLYIRLV